MTRSWGRLYAGTRNHRKIKILREQFPNHWTSWYVLIELAIECDDDGWIYVAPEVPFSHKQLAKEIGFTRVSTCLDFLNALVTLRLATINDKGILINSFSERNFESDISTPRVQKYREKLKTEQPQTDKVKRFRNVSVTDQNRTEQKQNRTEHKKKTPLPPDFSISESVRKWAEGKFDRLEDHLEAFIDYVKAHGKEYIDWDSAFKKAIREDWGKVRTTIQGKPKDEGPQWARELRGAK